MIILLNPMLSMGVFPEDIDTALRSYLKAPKAASCSHPALTRVLRKYDAPRPEVALETLPEGTEFIFRSKRYRIIELRRTRVKCLEVKNNKPWLINKLALVEPSVDN